MLALPSGNWATGNARGKGDMDVVNGSHVCVHVGCLKERVVRLCGVEMKMMG